MACAVRTVGILKNFLSTLNGHVYIILLEYGNVFYEMFMAALTLRLYAGGYDTFGSSCSVARIRVRKHNIFRAEMNFLSKYAVSLPLPIHVYGWRVVYKVHICTSTAHEEAKECRLASSSTKTVEK